LPSVKVLRWTRGLRRAVSPAAVVQDPIDAFLDCVKVNFVLMTAGAYTNKEG